jgi:hypothetical protein
MKKYTLSICIPARNEMFLKNTVEDILKNKRGDTEIIVGLDGKWADPPFVPHQDVKVVYVPESIGQRAMTKMCARISNAKFIAKTDGHCAFDEGFDVKLIEGFKKTGDNVVCAPTMRNLWIFDWKCYKCGWKKYQGPTPLVCPECGCKDKIKRKFMWIPKSNPQSNSFCFDSTPHFQYFNEYTKRECYKKDLAEAGLTESMSLQGSFWMCTREKYFELDLDDESFGSWGSMGILVACKFWLSGGRVLINHNTFYGHLFRTQGGDFGFPYPISDKQVQKAKSMAKDLFFLNKWEKQTKNLSWLVERFWPVKMWTQQDLDTLKLNDKNFS